MFGVYLLPPLMLSLGALHNPRKRYRDGMFLILWDARHPLIWGAHAKWVCEQSINEVECHYEMFPSHNMKDGEGEVRDGG